MLEVIYTELQSIVPRLTSKSHKSTGLINQSVAYAPFDLKKKSSIFILSEITSVRQNSPIFTLLDLIINWKLKNIV